MAPTEFDNRRLAYECRTSVSIDAGSYPKAGEDHLSASLHGTLPLRNIARGERTGKSYAPLSLSD
jgi:hypothetical protein